MPIKWNISMPRRNCKFLKNLIKKTFWEMIEFSMVNTRSWRYQEKPSFWVFPINRKLINVRRPYNVKFFYSINKVDNLIGLCIHFHKSIYYKWCVSNWKLHLYHYCMFVLLKTIFRNIVINKRYTTKTRSTKHKLLWSILSNNWMSDFSR